jgi:hypothetical protein
MVLTASYTDQGKNGVRPLTGVNSISLRGSTVPFSAATKSQGFSPIAFNGMNLLLLPDGPGWFVMEGIDLKGVNSAMIAAGWQAAPKSGVNFEMRLNAPDGEFLGSGSMPAPAAGQPGGMVMINLEKPRDIKAQEIYFVYTPKAGEPPGQMALMNVKFNGI